LICKGFAVSNPLNRKSLPVRLAEIIESECKTGEWGDTLPGHRTLMERYSVSAKTCLATMALLEMRGVISPAHQGSRRRILVKHGKTMKSLKDLLIIDGPGAPSGEDLLQIQAYRKEWEDAGGIVRNIKFDFPRFRRPAALLRETIAKHSADALLLHVPPLAWTQAAQEICPVFLSGGEWRGKELTGVGYHVLDEVARCVVKLRALGHERILIPLDLVGREMESAIRDGLAKGFDLPSNAPILRDLCPVFSERVPGAWQQYWKKAMAAVRPTAVILSADIHYLSLCGYCFRQGIRIPEDLSIICMESTEHLEWCEPVPTRMRFPVDAAARYFKKWLRSGCKPLGMKFLPLDFVDAGSVAVVRK
jgi:hypothetical protein